MDKEIKIQLDQLIINSQLQTIILAKSLGMTREDARKLLKMSPNKLSAIWKYLNFKDNK